MSSTPAQHAPVVTLAALSGAAGSLIGPGVAERLGVPFLDRMGPRTAAGEGGTGERLDPAEEPTTSVQRIATGLRHLSTITGGAGGSMERLDVEEAEVRSRTEAFLAHASRSGGVALGRGGMVVLRSVPWALHVYLGGPESARLAQRMSIEDIDESTAVGCQRAEDRARRSYVSRVYGVDGSDPDWYHVMLDSTALDIGVCVELIASAALARVRSPRPSPSI